MESQLLSLSKIFTERLFRIPDYQRGYAWKEPQIKDFWNDLIQLSIDKNHYVGVLTLEDVPKSKYLSWDDDYWIVDSKCYAPYYIVDGQQRLTTSIILIQAILEFTKDGEKINYTSKEDIKKKFIFESKDNGISKSYLFGYEKDNPSYEYLKTKILNEASEENFPVQETVYTYNLEVAKNYFKEQLERLSLNDIEIVYKKLTQNFLFNLYTISSDIEVFIAFETMNNRGKPLSHLELLKNRLIYLSTLFEVAEFEKEKLRKNINECWKDIYHYLGKNKLNPLIDDEFLTAHFVLYFGKEYKKDTSNSYYQYQYGYRNHMSTFEYKRYILEKKFIRKNIENSIDEETSSITIPYINEYVKSLKQSVKYWYYIYNPNDSEFDSSIREYLSKLNRIGLDSNALLIMVFLQNEADKQSVLEFLKVYEKYLFVLMLCRSIRYNMVKYNIEDRLNEIILAEKLFYNEISTNEIIKKVIDCTNALLSNKEVYNGINESFKRSGFYSWDGLKYFLYEYELELKMKSKSDTDKITWEDINVSRRDYETIEHIYPQRPRCDYWIERFDNLSNKEKNILKDSLGNLVPISKSKNSSLKNKSFIDKIGDDRTMIGYKYGSYSEIELTNYKEWSPKQIVDRGVKLLKFMEKRWGIKIENKIDFLGLTFLKL